MHTAARRRTVAALRITLTTLIVLSLVIATV
ncbi:hypothetical protein SAMN05421869_102385 [Nonomuraea jiangxiensis]|uniref:Uncharacterized protein n=1 Tax=Nonomuraea jiangxiensis TaxID=633440 RepID=A0A1G8CTC6_9ACTN|nr:hypothetical protein SAMN05421869_102385 [Nonomuraea jiangxiensis]